MSRPVGQETQSLNRQNKHGLARRILRDRRLQWPISMAFILVVLSVLAGGFFGKQGVEKLWTALVLPVGLLWWLVSSWMLLSWVGISASETSRNASRWLSMAIWTFLTLVCTAPFPVMCMRHLESQIPPFQPDDSQPLDAVVVLGGGTRSGPTRTEVGESGDRVVYAAQLYLQGNCRQLIATGSAAKGLSGVAEDPKDQTIQLWIGLGIPLTDISALPGRNTYEEIQSLKAYLSEHEGKRIGLLTSAFHLPRALRLAERAGIGDCVPIAADHHADQAQRITIYSFLPSAGNLEMISIVQREWMGKLIGR
jgi:uncharacterized SAM-binding protein YcdF (DUF218 family)